MLQVVRISKENMVNPTTQREIQVGAFVLVGAVILAVFVILLADVSLEPRVQLFADFGYSGALKVGAPVILSGVRIGRVADLSLLGRPPVHPPRNRWVTSVERRNLSFVLNWRLKSRWSSSCLRTRGFMSGCKA